METYEIRIVCSHAAVDDAEPIILNTSCYLDSATKILPAWKEYWWRDINLEKQEVVYQATVSYSSSAMKVWCDKLFSTLDSKEFDFSIEMNKKIFSGVSE